MESKLWTRGWGLAACLLVAVMVGDARGQSSETDGADIVQPETVRLELVGGLYHLESPDGRTIRVTDSVIADERLIAWPGSATRLVTWNEGTDGVKQPYYAISVDGQPYSRPRATSYQIKLRHGEFDPRVRVNDVSLPLMSAADEELHIVQFEVQPLEEFRVTLRAMGATVYGYLAHHAHIVRMTPAVRQRVEALPYVRWVGAFHPAYRLEAALLDALRQDMNLPPARYNIQVFDAGAGQKDAVANRIAALGGTIIHLPPQSSHFEAELTGAQLVAAARWPEVAFIDRWFAPEPDMSIVRLVSGADFIEAVDGYDGAGVRGEVVDGNVLESHVDFASRPLLLHGPKDGNPNHGTSTTGINFGDGTGSGSARGVLPAGQGIFADYSFLSDRYAHTQQLRSAPYNAVFQSNSWGSGLTTAYSTSSQQMDEIIFDLDMLICNSQSNTGSQLSRPQAWAKNIVSVGGINHNNTATFSDDAWSFSASIGPAEDGRVKPDLSHFNDSVFTTEGDGGYSEFGGTSAATPITAGYFGLFFQMWSEGIFGNEVSGGTVFQERAHASTAKAMMINTAASYPFSGTFHDLTRTHQGWGIANVQRMYELRDNMLVVNEDDVLAELETIGYARAFSPGVPNHHELRATLVYTDLPGTTSSSRHRINDLSLKVTSPLGIVFWGNNGLLTGNWSTPGGVANTIDTVENVFVNNPEQGIWTVEVFADEINQDGHVETPGADADYALVVSGGDSCLFADFIVEPGDTYTCFGEDVLLEADVADFTALQWYKDGVPLEGETGLSLAITDFAPSDEGEYRLAATNECGQRFSAAALVADSGEPIITQQPVPPASIRCESDDLFLQVQAGGIGPFTYQWYHEGEAVEGATSASLLLSPAGPGSAGVYFCEVSNPCNTTVSDAVEVEIAPAPVFTLQPQDTCGEVGTTIVLTVSATASAPFTYQWRKGSTVVGSGDTLTIADLEPSDAGDYRVLAFTFDPICIASSATATVTVGDCVACATPGDMDGDGDYDLADLAQFTRCFGPSGAMTPGCACANLDVSDDDVDLIDWTLLHSLLLGPQ